MGLGNGFIIHVPNESIVLGPERVGPCIVWAEDQWWLTWRERFQLWRGARTVEDIARQRMPVMAWLRDEINRTWKRA
jgi:hypothetical protein